MIEQIYKNKKVFVTGHNSFKGSWLCLWLERLGAEIIGYSLAPPSQPNHYSLLNLKLSKEYINDLRDYKVLLSAVQETQPDIVFHLGAQSSVLYSYSNPLETYESNAMGTANILEVCRTVRSIKAVVVITTDKCYENKEWYWGYRETDALGGHDPYSTSKALAELITSSYIRSFFPIDRYKEEHNVLIASARSGNVVGGGDWKDDRLIPDAVRTAAKGGQVVIRNPKSTRPWQHVLEPLHGYLLLGEKLLMEDKLYSGAWNFGSDEDSNQTTLNVIDELKKYWAKIDYRIEVNPNANHEANLLKLDSSKVKTLLKWRPIWDFSQMIEKTATWYQQFYEKGNIVSSIQLNEYVIGLLNSKSL